MTEQINNNLNPNWAPLLLNSRACGGLDQQLRLSVYDFDHDGTHVRPAPIPCTSAAFGQDHRP